MKRRRTNPKSASPQGAKSLPNFSKYLVLPDGTVYSKRTRKILIAFPDSKGYPQLWLKSDTGTKKWWTVHRMVALLYVHNPDPTRKKLVHHLDHDRTNANASNLVWVTQAENLQYAAKAGRMGKRGLLGVKGADHPKHGTKVSEASKKKMSEAKSGDKSPRFKGDYTYRDISRPSISGLAKAIGKSPYKVRVLLKRGEILFKPKTSRDGNKQN